MEEQEVELIDFLGVIWKRKWLLVGGSSIAVIVALLVSLFLPKTYAVSRTLRIGQVGTTSLESRESVNDRLRDERILAALIKEFQLKVTPREMAERQIFIDAKAPNVRYTVLASEPVLAMRIADSLAETITANHKRMFDERVEVAREHEAELVASIRAIEAELEGMKKTLETASKAVKTDAPAVILMQANIEDRQRSLANLHRELSQTRVSLLPPESQNTIVISADTLPKRPLKPKVTLNAVLAGALGLMVLTFLAFFLEYLEKARGRVRGDVGATADRRS